MNLSFVIPCYNEEKNIPELYREIFSVFSETEISYELVFVNDGSKDETKSVLKKLMEDNPDVPIRAIHFSRNFGKEAAIYCGMKYAKGDYVCFMDADLQQPPEIALSMYRKLCGKEDLDCVAAYQDIRNENFVMSFSKKCFYRLVNKISEIPMPENASDFRMCSRRMVSAMLSLPEADRFSKGIFSWVGFETLYIPYQAKKRKNGKTKWTFRKLFSYALSGIVGYTTVPLKISTILGFILSVIAIIYMMVLIIKTLIIGIEVPGYATTLGFILLIGGIQLLMLGIIGEYLAKSYLQGKNRPLYIVKDLWENKNE